MSGSVLFDTEGRRYLDFLGGLAVTSLGHSHPAVAEAWPIRPDPAPRLQPLRQRRRPGVAATLDRLIGGGVDRAGGQVFFTNSGAEANECAIKLARKWAGPGRHVVISAWDSFHGRTLATLHATGQPAKHAPFAPLPEGFEHVPYDDFDALDAACDRTRVAAVLLEPVQGEAGVIVPSSDYLTAVAGPLRRAGHSPDGRRGPDRTGPHRPLVRLPAHAVMPDIVTMAKALGNGVPIGACWARAEVAAAFGRATTVPPSAASRWPRRRRRPPWP